MGTLSVSAEYSIRQESANQDIVLNSTSTEFLFSSTGLLERIRQKDCVSGALTCICEMWK